MSSAHATGGLPSGDGEEYYAVQLERCSIMQSQIPGQVMELAELDELFQGGLRMGTLSEICGVSGSGKTQLCLNIAINWTVYYKIDVLYVDTKGEIVGSRLSSLIDEHRLLESTERISERIKIIKARDIYDLIATLHYLQLTMGARKKLKAIIVDSIAALYVPFIGSASGDNHDGISLLSHVAALLANFAIRHNLAVVLINLALQWRQEEGPSETDVDPEQATADDRSIKPAMGKFWAHVPNTRLLLAKTPQTINCSTARVLKSDYLAEGNFCNLLMNLNGTIT